MEISFVPVKRKRKETPVLVKAKGGMKPKDKLERALAVARFLKAKQCKTPPIVKFFDANSSKHSKDAKRRTTLKILEELAGEGQAMPLDVDLLLNFASSLKEGGYTAGDGYLIEAKLLHVEGGHGWNEQLDRCFKQCKRALTRGKGPSKKAPEVELHQREKRLKPNWGKAATLVKFGVELFLFAMTWMLRELELVCMDTDDVFFVDHTRKKVTITINTSKMDPEAKGVKRTLQCLCTGAACERECPFSVSYKLVTLVESFNGTGSMLALKKNKKSPSKYAVVNTWRAHLGPGLTGHSARRTGALKYIREGWSVSKVAPWAVEIDSDPPLCGGSFGDHARKCGEANSRQNGRSRWKQLELGRVRGVQGLDFKVARRSEGAQENDCIPWRRTGEGSWDVAKPRNSTRRNVANQSA